MVERIVSTIIKGYHFRGKFRTECIQKKQSQTKLILGREHEHRELTTQNFDVSINHLDE